MSDEKRPREKRVFFVGEYEVLIDDEDWPVVSRYTWHIKRDKKSFYVNTAIKIADRPYILSLHRLITGMKSSQIDHKNRNGLDNRKENLRYATNAQNSCNRVRKNKFNYRGVFQTPRSVSFSVQIQINGKKVHRHGFATPEDAAREYDKLSKEFHGEFGIRNFKD